MNELAMQQDMGIFQSQKETIIQRFLKTAKDRADKPAYYEEAPGKWIPTNWETYLQQVENVARSLIELGVKKGDTVSILSYNRPEWAIMDFAIMMIGAATTGIYWTSSPEEIEFVLADSKSRVLLIEKRDQLAELSESLDRFEELQNVVVLDEECQGDTYLAWSKFLELGTGKPELEIERQKRVKALDGEDIATKIYTSGTTGAPKVVLLSHRSLQAEADGLTERRELSPDERYISYLPLAHIVEKLGTIILPANRGYPVYYVHDFETLANHIQSVRPTFFGGVPRVYEKMKEKLEAKLRETTGIKATLAHWSMATARTYNEKLLAKQPISPLLRFKKRIANKLVLSKIKEAMGFDQTTDFLSGAAAMPLEALRFFSGLDIIILEGYGLSETCGSASFNSPSETKLGSVGKPIPGFEIKIAPDGEVLIRGGGLFSGYGNNQKATNECMIGGWFYTGDLGRIDDDGYLFITGRKKDIIVTSGGKNISPAMIEGDLISAPMIEHAIIVGDDRKYLSALISLDPESLEVFAEKEGLSVQGALQSIVLNNYLQSVIDEVNKRHARVEHIRRFKVLPEGLSIEGGELTATMKVKRKTVISNHKALVDSIYEEG
ncbi:AMP-dependent synthetase/ligase [Flexibacterium corallicola]|uniref:AMP-dependent synthetase/ligase n=1 Tax=Flexibacterium corallicola TaxID=3037259 RepID=UPI00286F623E|nr:long-chain fatty acid--CoA ligase [Pseudovibrio sp. M1P-2-3]